jgi:hypothetical protein
LIEEDDAQGEWWAREDKLLKRYKLEKLNGESRSYRKGRNGGRLI